MTATVHRAFLQYRTQTCAVRPDLARPGSHAAARCHGTKLTSGNE